MTDVKNRRGGFYWTLMYWYGIIITRCLHLDANIVGKGLLAEGAEKKGQNFVQDDAKGLLRRGSRLRGLSIKGLEHISNVGFVAKGFIAILRKLIEGNIAQWSVAIKTRTGANGWGGRNIGTGRKGFYCLGMSIFGGLITLIAIVLRELRNTVLLWKESWEDILQKTRKFIIKTVLRPTIELTILN